jgi:hypothetical protein
MADEPTLTENDIKFAPIGFINSDGKGPSSKEAENERPGAALGWSANLTPIDGDRLASSRRAWQEAGKHLTDPAAQAAHMARFDEAAKSDNPDYVPPDLANEKLLKDHGLASSDPKNFHFQHTLATKHAGEIGGLMAGAKFQSGLAGSLGDHLAAMGPKLQAMTANQRANWLAQQNTQLEKLAGGKKAAEQVTKDAEEMLKRLHSLPETSGGRLAKDLTGTHLMKSAFVQLSFANQLAMHKSYEAAVARKSHARKS